MLASCPLGLSQTSGAMMENPVRELPSVLPDQFVFGVKHASLQKPLWFEAHLRSDVEAEVERLDLTGAEIIRVWPDHKARFHCKRCNASYTAPFRVVGVHDLIHKCFYCGTEARKSASRAKYLGSAVPREPASIRHGDEQITKGDRAVARELALEGLLPRGAEIAQPDGKGGTRWTRLQPEPSVSGDAGSRDTSRSRRTGAIWWVVGAVAVVGLAIPVAGWITPGFFNGSESSSATASAAQPPPDEVDIRSEARATTDTDMPERRPVSVASVAPQVRESPAVGSERASASVEAAKRQESSTRRMGAVPRELADSMSQGGVIHLSGPVGVFTLTPDSSLDSQVITAKGLRSALQTIEGRYARTAVLVIDTPGGSEEEMFRILDVINEFRARMRIVAVVPEQAMSAGAIIALACDAVFMDERGRIGAATAYTSRDQWTPVDAKMNAASSAKARTYMADDSRKHLVRAMMEPSVELFAWIGPDGKTSIGQNPPSVGVVAESICREDEILAMEGVEMIRLGLAYPLDGLERVDVSLEDPKLARLVAAPANELIQAMRDLRDKLAEAANKDAEAEEAKQRREREQALERQRQAQAAARERQKQVDRLVEMVSVIRGDMAAVSRLHPESFTDYSTYYDRHFNRWRMDASSRDRWRQRSRAAMQRYANIRAGIEDIAEHMKKHDLRSDFPEVEIEITTWYNTADQEWSRLNEQMNRDVPP